MNTNISRHYYLYFILLFIISIHFGCQNSIERPTLDEIKIKADNYLEDIFKVRIEQCDSVAPIPHKENVLSFTIMDNSSKLCLTYPHNLFISKNLEKAVFETVSPKNSRHVIFPIVGTINDEDLHPSSSSSYRINNKSEHYKGKDIYIYELKYDYNRFNGSYYIRLVYPNPIDENMTIRAHFFFKEEQTSEIKNDRM